MITSVSGRGTDLSGVGFFCFFFFLFLSLFLFSSFFSLSFPPFFLGGEWLFTARKNKIKKKKKERQGSNYPVQNSDPAEGKSGSRASASE